VAREATPVQATRRDGAPHGHPQAPAPSPSHTPVSTRSTDTPALRAVAEELDTLLLRIEPSAPVAEDADPDDLLAQDRSLRGAFLLFILGLLRSRRYAAPYDVIQRVKGELPMITDTIDNVATVERQQGIAPAGPKNGTNGHSGR